MANVVAGLLKLIFGSKADKDRKAVIPYIEKINAVYPQIEKLTDDELRARSSALMARIADAIADDETRIASLKEELERSDISIEEKEKISTDIEHLTKNIDDTIEKVLLEILPEAFAIMKDTARRFKRERIRGSDRYGPRPRLGHPLGLRHHRG